MNATGSLQFLAQAAQDLATTLPVAAREPFLQAAQYHLNELQQALTPAVELDGRPEAEEIYRGAPDTP